MSRIQLVQHASGAPGLRWFGLGPGLKPTRALRKLRRLLDKHATWAQGRSDQQLRTMLAGSNVVVTLWRDKRMVGFGRATTDGIYRAVLWDVVVAGDLQGRGLGRQVVEALINHASVGNAEIIYLMTTRSAGFYEQLGFKSAAPQQLLIANNKDMIYKRVKP